MRQNVATLCRPQNFSLETLSLTPTMQLVLDWRTALFSISSAAIASLYLFYKFRVNYELERRNNQRLSGYTDDDLFYAAFRGDLELLKRILENSIIDVNAANADGCTSLFMAVESEQLVAMRYLVSQGALLNVRRVIRSVEGGEPGAEGAVTKLVGSVSAQERARVAARLVGEHAATMSAAVSDPAKFALQARSSTIAGGTSEIVRNQIAERVLGLPREPNLK